MFRLDIYIRPIAVLVGALLMVTFPDHVSGQQVNQYSLYTLNPYEVNLATAGLDGNLSITGVYRNQWAGIAGQPVSQILNAHLPVFITNGGSGISFENTSIGAEQRLRAGITYNQLLSLGQHMLLSVGAGAYFHNYSLDGSILRAPDGVYENGIDHQDPNLPISNVSASGIGIGAAIFLKISNIKIGYQLRPATDNSFNLLNNGQILTELNLKRHHFVYSAYLMNLGEELQLEPNILFKSDELLNQIDIGIKANILGTYIAGVSVRGILDGLESMIIFAGTNLGENLSIAYGFDYLLSDIGNVSSGSHEIILRYDFLKKIGSGRPPRVIFNPRF